MAVGFTTKERESITEALLRAAGRHAALSGMKKTSVDELCAEAGISKGAFYSFYPSKEHLFLTVMERWQEEISRQAEAALRQAGKLNGPQRAALMMKTACRAMRKKSMERFLRASGLRSAIICFTFSKAASIVWRNGDGVVEPEEWVKECPCFEVSKDL